MDMLVILCPHALKLIRPPLEGNIACTYILCSNTCVATRWQAYIFLISMKYICFGNNEMWACESRFKIERISI